VLDQVPANVLEENTNTNPCTAWRLSIWRSCAGPSLTSRGAVTSALQHVDFCSHLAITCQRMEDEPFLMPVHLPEIFDSLFWCWINISSFCFPCFNVGPRHQEVLLSVLFCLCQSCPDRKADAHRPIYIFWINVKNCNFKT